MIELLSQVNKTVETLSLNNPIVANATINNNKFIYTEEVLQSNIINMRNNDENIIHPLDFERFNKMLEEMGVFESIRSMTIESESGVRIPYGLNIPSTRYITPSGNTLIAEGDNVEIRATLNGETIGRIDSITYTIDGDR